MDSIGDLALLSDCRTAALVDREGTVCWFSPGRFDNPTVFARLLDADAGHWSVTPAGEVRSSQRAYIDDGPILQTTLTTTDGEVTLTDALGLRPGSRGHEIQGGRDTVLLRRAACTRGQVTLESDLAARPEYGLTTPHLLEDGEGWQLIGGTTPMHLRGSVPHASAGGSLHASVTLSVGESAEWVLACGEVDGRPAAKLLEETRAGWSSWAALHPALAGPHGAAMRRSAMVLQALTYAPSGVVIAAPTTSLPERIGQEWNWDYRYAWLRDLTFVVQALWIAACPDEPARYLEWIARALGRIDGQDPQIMFGVEGERDLTERTLDHLSGYRDSRPVRIGNDAWSQRQLDVPGEVLDSALLMRKYLGDPVPVRVRETLVALADRAEATWKEPDFGMWEARDRTRHYLSSKVMGWVALDRAIQLAGPLEAAGKVAGWTRQRDRVRRAVLEDGWNPDVRAFTGAIGSDELDASVLLMPLVGIVEPDDERWRATVERVEERLASEHGVQRWQDEGSGFVLCGFWLAECLALMGERERAEERFAATAACANDLGLMAEEVAIDSGEPLGNMPQALSHVGLINAAWRLTEGRKDSPTHD